MKLFEITSEEEYNQLKNMYRSEGFGTYLRLLDSLIGQTYNRIIDDKSKNDEVINLVQRIKGLSQAKDICFNALKENESKFKRD